MITHQEIDKGDIYGKICMILHILLTTEFCDLSYFVNLLLYKLN